MHETRRHRISFSRFLVDPKTAISSVMLARTTLANYTPQPRGSSSRGWVAGRPPRRAPFLWSPRLRNPRRKRLRRRPCTPRPTSSCLPWTRKPSSRTRRTDPSRRCAGHLSLFFTALGESDYQKHIVKWSPASWNAVKINENGKKIKIFAPVGRPVARLVARGRPRAGMLSKTSVWGLSPVSFYYTYGAHAVEELKR